MFACQLRSDLQLYQKVSPEGDLPEQLQKEKEETTTKATTPKREEPIPSTSIPPKKEEKEKVIEEVEKIEIEVKEKKGRVDMDTVLKDLKAELK